MAEERDLMTREIEEELRRERMLKLWDRFGVYIVGAGVATGAGRRRSGSTTSHRQARAADAASSDYIIALTEFDAKRPDKGATSAR